MKEVILSYFKLISWNLSEGTEETHENLGNSWVPDRESNPWPREYVKGEAMARPQHPGFVILVISGHVRATVVHY
jgi:hypothetical protein